MRCPACEGPSEVFGQTRVLGDVDATFLRCTSCRSVYAYEPTWLPRSYSRAIADRDIGLIGRNVTLAGATRRVLRVFFPRARVFLDFGAGTGMFVRLMRDAGYDFRYLDAYGPNLYAIGHEAEQPADPFDVVTAFEVIEHLEDPVTELQPAVAGAQGLIATTEPLPDPAPPLDRWWYYSLATGQHITLLSQRGLDVVGERLGFVRASCGSYHVFSRKRLQHPVLRLLVSDRAGTMLGRLGCRPSLLPADFLSLTGEHLDNA